MRKHLLFVIPFFFCLCNFSFSQSGLSGVPEFGSFSQAELVMQECSFDKDANAIILFDDAYADYDEDYQLITRRHVRIKILNEKGMDEGNIRIRFYSNNDFEFIKDLKAATFNRNEDGSESSYYVDKRSFFTEKEDNYYSSIKFAFPNVKAGSILEYRYESVMKHFGGLEKWLFQSDIPVLRSCYQLALYPGLEFEYTVQKKRTYPIILKNMPDVGQTYFEMDNIPGLLEEPYMDAVKDYMQRVEFQFAGYTSRRGSTTKGITTWKDAAYELATDKGLGAIKKTVSPIDDVKAIVDKESSASGKLKAIYNYVRKNISWNGYYSKYAADGLKSAWDKKTGHAAEVNLILLNLLQNFDIEAYPLLVAERDYGRIDTTYPFIDKFNKTAVYAIADGQEYILDATQKSCPPNLVPFSLLNTYAFLIDKKKYKLFQISGGAVSYKNQVFVKANLSENGVITGNADIVSVDYAKQFREEEIKKDEKKFVSRTFQQPYEGMAVDSFYYQNLDNDMEPLMQHINFRNELSESGGFVFLNYNLFTGLEKNPFTKPDRFTNIDFGYPYAVSVEQEIELPKNAKIDDLPKDKTLVTPRRDISIARKISKDGNKLHIRIDFVQTTTLIYAEQYEGLKQFYRTMTDMLNEPVVIKLQK